MKTLLFLSLLMLSACGMPGGLYLPDDEPENRASNISSKNAIQKT